MSYPLLHREGMNKNPILPNWQLPRRRPFTANRGIAMLKALRERLANEPKEIHVQTHFAFASRAGR